MNSDRETLIELMLAGELSEAQRVQLSDLAAVDAAVAEEILDQMWLEPLLRDSLSRDPDTFVRRIEAAFERDDADSTEFTDQILDAWSDRVAQRSRSRRMRTVSAIALSALVFVAVVFLRQDSGKELLAATFRLQHSIGSVSIVGSDGNSREAEPGVSLKPGDTVITQGESSAVLTCSNGSVLTLVRDAALRLPVNGQRGVILNSGMAVVQKSTADNPDSQMIESVMLETQHGSVEISDSQLVLATTELQTDLTVARGRTVLKISNGKSITMFSGECAIAKAESLDLRRGSPTPDEWSEDFEAGLPEGWTGHLIEKELPAGSRGAVGTARSTNADGEECHQIWSASRWEHGLAVVHPDTHLNFAYRFKKADRVLVLALLRSPVPDSATHDVQMLQPSEVTDSEQWWDVPAGQWHVASIPLALLSNPVTREHSEASSVATAFNFRPQDDACGLTIDRTWLSRGGPGRITFKPLASEADSSVPQ